MRSDQPAVARVLVSLSLLLAVSVGAVRELETLETVSGTVRELETVSGTRHYQLDCPAEGVTGGGSLTSKT